MARHLPMPRVCRRRALCCALLEESESGPAFSAAKQIPRRPRVSTVSVTEQCLESARAKGCQLSTPFSPMELVMRSAVAKLVTNGMSRGSVSNQPVILKWFRLSR